jgi:hypothetical protein
MIGIWKVAIIAAGLLLVGSVVANPQATLSAPKHAAAKAMEMASGHSILHRNSAAASDADRQCDTYRNHGDYVSSVAQNASRDSDDDNETRDDHGERGNHSNDQNETRDERGNRTHDDNETHDQREHRNQTHERDNETDEHDDGADDGGHGQAVSEAAHSDIGKCGGSDHDDKSENSHDEGSADDQDDESHGRSDEARSEHPPQNDEREKDR